MTVGRLRRFASEGAVTARAIRDRVLRRFGAPVLVLLYHRVSTLRSDPHALAVSPDRFREQVAHVKREYPIVRLEDDWSAVREPSIAITFDDGYADNVTEALPILEDLGAPATFFVATGPVRDGGRFWWDELDALVDEGAADRPFLMTDANGVTREWSAAHPAERQAMHGDLHRLLRGLDARGREVVLERLRRWSRAAAGRGEDRVMTVDEVRRLAASPVATLGAHTVTHSALSRLGAVAQRDEIARSRRELEQWTGRAVTVFSYPFGGPLDYDRTSRRVCRELGFAKAAANYPGLAYRWTDPLQLPRHVVRNWPLAEFSSRLAEFWAG